MFDTRFKTLAHIAQLILTLIVLALAGYRMSNRDPTRRRNTGDTMAIGMSAKALIVIGYQLLSEHVARFHRWASCKANLILNCLEVVFWAVVAGMGMQGLSLFCGEGAACATGWILHIMALVLSLMAMYVSVLSWKEFRAAKVGGYHADGQIHMSSANSKV